MAKWLRRQPRKDMKYTVYDLDVMGSNPSQIELGCKVPMSESYLNQKYIL